jgi:hypothetical protein
MFDQCTFLEDVSHFVISGVSHTSTNNNSMFNSCGRLKKLPKTITGERGNREMFKHCTRLENVNLDLSESLDNTNMFNYARGLTNARLSGVKASIGFYDCNLGSGNITNIFNDLETVSSATIDIRENYGTSWLHSDTIAIATNKGWTVTT